MARETDSLELTTRLVYLAAERTLMSWIRSAAGLMALGFVIDRFAFFVQQTSPGSGDIVNPRVLSFRAGAGMVILGAIMAVVAAGRYGIFAWRYHRDGRTDTGLGLVVGVAFTLFLAVIGVVIAAFLLTVTK